MKKFRFALFSKSAKMFAAMATISCATLCLTAGSWMSTATVWAQTAPAAAPASDSANAKIHGHAQDPVGQPVPDVEVQLTHNGKTPLFTFKTNENGDYSGSGITPGKYTILLYGKAKGPSGISKPSTIDFQKDVELPAGQDVEVNFDMTRQAYIEKLPSDVQEKVKKIQKQNAKASQANQKIGNANNLMKEARAARKAGDFDKAIALDTQATQAMPTSGLTWFELGDSYLGAKKYSDAITNYQKALPMLTGESSPKMSVISGLYNNLGEAQAHSGKVTDAVASYEAAAKADPTQAGMYYTNEAIVLFKTGAADPAKAAADKAITADPNKAIPYYIKGWALVQQATVDPKTNKIVLPPGCADAYRKFIQLSPTGSLAVEATNILKQAGEPLH